MSSSTTAFVYLRDVDSTGDGPSIASQRLACLRKAESLGADIIDEFVDSSSTAKRPALWRLVASLTKRRAQHVIVQDVALLSHESIGASDVARAVQRAGALLIGCEGAPEETAADVPVGNIVRTVHELDGPATPSHGIDRSAR